MKLLLALVLISTNVFAYDLTNESELGQAMTGGNSKSRSLTGKTVSNLTIDKNKYLIQGFFFQQDTNGLQTAERWNAKISYERKLLEKVSAQISHEAEADKFAGYNPRYNTDIGSVYYFQNDPKKIITSLALAYRYTHENTTTGQVNYFNKMILTGFHKNQVTEAFFYETKLEYIPNIDESDAYIINGNASAGFIMSKSFSIKINYLAMYQNVPLVEGNERLDYTQTVTLVSKF